MEGFLKNLHLSRIIVGMVLMAVIGFGFMGWTLGGSATKMADAAAKGAVTQALTPYCVAAAKADTDAARMTEFAAANASSRAGLVEKFGWATPPGAEKPNRDVAKACATALVA
jgi:hypothetical protein